MKTLHVRRAQRKYCVPPPSAACPPPRCTNPSCEECKKTLGTLPPDRNMPPRKFRRKSCEEPEKLLIATAPPPPYHKHGSHTSVQMPHMRNPRNAGFDSLQRKNSIYHIFNGGMGVVLFLERDACSVIE